MAPRGRDRSIPHEHRQGTFGAAHVDPRDAYAGVPILQEPRWHDEIAAYFYLGGISSGAFLIGAIAEFSGERWRALSPSAFAVAFATVIPCVPLLIHDLGKPRRFYHMLRIFKPSSPMNLGSWTLFAHSACSTLLAFECLVSHQQDQNAYRIVQRLPRRAIAVVGFVPAMLLGGYSGVLLGTTSVPVWSRSSLLGGLFMSSAVATGSSAVALASLIPGRDQRSAHDALGAIGIAAGATELALAAGYVATSGAAATPLRTGGEGRLFLGAIVSTAAAVALDVAASRNSNRQGSLGAIAAIASLAGGAMLRWAVVRAGRASAADRDATLESMRPSQGNPGWWPARNEKNST